MCPWAPVELAVLRTAKACRDVALLKRCQDDVSPLFCSSHLLPLPPPLASQAAHVVFEIETTAAFAAAGLAHGAPRAFEGVEASAISRGGRSLDVI